MNTLLNYLLEVSIGLVLFYGTYHFVLRNETNFHFNRIFLLSSLACSLLLPLITINLFSAESSTAIPTLGEAIPTYWLPEYTISATQVQQETAMTWKVLFTLYYLGIAILLARLFFQIKSISKYIRNSSINKLDNIYVLEIHQNAPTFSFFNYIFIGQSHLLNEAEKRTILEHERAHALHFHSIDILFVNIMCTLFWFNPIIYLYKKSLVQLHEFEADSRAVENLGANAYCSLLAKVALQSAEFPIANHFNNSLTLKRIFMIKTIKKNVSAWKKVVLLPMIAFCFFIIACEDQVMNDIKDVAKQSTVVETYPMEVSKAISELKAKYPKAEYQVMGLMTNDTKSLNVPAGDAIHIITPKNSEKSEFEKYVLIVKSGTMDQLSELTMEKDVFTVVEETATPVEGMKVYYGNIAKNLKYPVEARSANIEGKVFVQFIINENGTLSNFQVIKGIGHGCDEEAMRAVQTAGAWTPGKNKGVTVKQRMVLPVSFKLGGEVEPIASDKYDHERTLKEQFIPEIVSREVKNNVTLVHGIVKNSEGNVLPGVQVVEAGTGNKTVSDLEGKFALRVDNPMGTIEFSMVGYPKVAMYWN